MNAPTRGPVALRQRAVLAQVLARAGQAGWTAQTLRDGALACGEDAADLAVLFPEGISDVLRVYSQSLDEAMQGALDAAPLGELKIRDRIKRGIRARIEAIEPHFEAGRRAAALLMLPPFAPLCLALAAKTVDVLWRAVGDRATDFNFYTKRALAAGVYLSTLMMWFRDRSADHEATWAFLDRRLSDIMVIEGTKIQLRKLGALMPSPWALFGMLRYPDRPDHPPAKDGASDA